jgi:hypothetical protein
VSGDPKRPDQALPTTPETLALVEEALANIRERLAEAGLSEEDLRDHVAQSLVDDFADTALQPGDRIS